MSWLIIGVILLAAFGPVLWLMPSKRDRYLSGLRQQARLDGLIVELRHLPKLDPAPEDRVSAGGKLREPLVDCASYSHMFPRRLRVLGGWRLLRSPGADEGSDIPAGWVIDPGMRAARSEVAEILDCLLPLLPELPEDVIGVELSAAAATIYWLEKSGASPGTVTHFSDVLRQFGEQLMALDQLREDDLSRDDS
jgi:hypothetical protein